MLATITVSVYSAKRYSRDTVSQHISSVYNISARLRLAAIFCLLIGLAICFRLFSLMIIDHDGYVALAQGTHETTEQLYPVRGKIFFTDSRNQESSILAMNSDVFTVFADNRQIKTDEERQNIISVLSGYFNYTDERKEKILEQLKKVDDPYEPLEQKVEETLADEIKSKNLPGVGFARAPIRIYPEKTIASHVAGFMGKAENGGSIGQYGIEGYFQKELAGKGGFFEGMIGAKGSWISLSDKKFEPAENGSDIVLTIDRNVQYKTCEFLRAGMTEYKATSGAVIVMDPFTGAIIAMCSMPDFDPNVYNQVDSIDVYNNTTIFTPYEPGSVFKAVTMSAALNEGLVNPNTPFFDPGFADAGCSKSIHNANDKEYGSITMTGVMENSVNTGLVKVVSLLGKKRFEKYVADFGFGVKTGITLDTENSGDISSLSKNKSNEFDCYTATASFGQGITATPLQMISAYATIANGGTLFQPYIVSAIIKNNGSRETKKPTIIKTILSKSAADLMSGMLVSVIDNGHTPSARIKGYYVAGKTGTAQIAGPGGYTLEMNHTFIGFAPISHPKFVVLVKYEKPQRAFADSTAAPTFNKIASFLLDYYNVPPER